MIYLGVTLVLSQLVIAFGIKTMFDMVRHNAQDRKELELRFLAAGGKYDEASVAKTMTDIAGPPEEISYVDENRAYELQRSDGS